MDAPAPSLREQGLQALRENNLDRAIDFLARAVMADDNDLEAKVLLGIAYSQKGLHTQAKRALQTAVELQPQNPNFRFNLGVVAGAGGGPPDRRHRLPGHPPANKDHAQARAKLQAMGPQAHQLLANAPKPIEPVGVPGHSPPPAGAAARRASHGRTPDAPPAPHPRWDTRRPMAGPPIGGPPRRATARPAASPNTAGDWRLRRGRPEPCSAPLRAVQPARPLLRVVQLADGPALFRRPVTSRPRRRSPAATASARPRARQLRSWARRSGTGGMHV